MDISKIIKIGPSNVRELHQIARQTFIETFIEMNTSENMSEYLEKNLSCEKLAGEINNEDSEFYFALHSDAVVGYLKLNFGPAQTEPVKDHALEIERIYVLKTFHGSGIGQLLYQKAVQVAKDKSVDYIWLGVWEKNLRAIQFYNKNGFIEFGKHVFKLGSDEQTDIIMKLDLGTRNPNT